MVALVGKVNGSLRPIEVDLRTTDRGGLRTNVHMKWPGGGRWDSEEGDGFTERTAARLLGRCWN